MHKTERHKIQPSASADIHTHTCTHKFTYTHKCTHTHMKEQHPATSLGLAWAICVRCIYGTFGLKITKCTVMYGAYIRFYPTRHTSLTSYALSSSIAFSAFRSVITPTAAARGIGEDLFRVGIGHDHTVGIGHCSIQWALVTTIQCALVIGHDHTVGIGHCSRPYSGHCS